MHSRRGGQPLRRGAVGLTERVWWRTPRTGLCDDHVFRAPSTGLVLAGPEYRDTMATNDDAVGPMGDLTLADTMLGQLVKSLLQWVDNPIREGATAAQAAHRLQETWNGQGWCDRLPDLDLLPWVEEVIDASHARTQVVHAVAHARCIECGEVSHYTHHRSEGEPVNRSPEALHELATRIDGLMARGWDLARDMASEGLGPRTDGFNVCPDCSSSGKWQVVKDLRIGPLPRQPPGPTSPTSTPAP